MLAKYLIYLAQLSPTVEIPTLTKGGSRQVPWSQTRIERPLHQPPAKQQQKGVLRSSGELGAKRRGGQFTIEFECTHVMQNLVTLTSLSLPDKSNAFNFNQIYI